MRSQDIKNIIEIVRVLADPNTELVYDLYVGGLVFDSIELTETGFNLNKWWSDEDGDNEDSIDDDQLSDDMISELKKELEEIF